jgi:chromosome segregation ATPase
MADQIPTTVELFLSIHKRLEQITNSLTELHAAVNSVIKKEKQMTTEMLVLKEKVAQNTNLVDSAITLINGISTQLEAIKGDPAAITEFIAELEASNSELAAKIVENTPAA